MLPAVNQPLEDTDVIDHFPPEDTSLNLNQLRSPTPTDHDGFKTPPEYTGHPSDFYTVPPGDEAVSPRDGSGW